MTRIRKVGALLIAAPLALTLPVVGPAAPANAAISGSITSPSNGKVITSGSSVTVRANYVAVGGMNLLVDTPGGGARLIATSRPLSVSGTMSSSVGIGRNGRYQARLKGKTTGITYDTSTFYVRIAPAAPGGLSASPSGGKVTVRWSRGSESDLTGYSVSGGLGSKSGSVGSLCSGGSCSVTMPAPAASGRPIPVSVHARRSTGTGGTISSPASSTTVSLAGLSGASGSNGGAAANAPGTAGPNGTDPRTGGSSPALPPVQPDGAGTGFTYPMPDPVVAGPDAAKAENAAARDSLQWGKSVAVALILLIIAAHLSTWTRRLRVAQAGFNSLGMAARMARGGSGRTRVQRARDRIARAEASAKTAKRFARTSKGPARPEMPAPSTEPPAAGGPKAAGPQRPAASALNAKAATLVMPTVLEASGADVPESRAQWPPRRSSAQPAGRGRRQTTRTRRRSGRRRS